MTLWFGFDEFEFYTPKSSERKFSSLIRKHRTHDDDPELQRAPSTLDIYIISHFVKYFSQQLIEKKNLSVQFKYNEAEIFPHPAPNQPRHHHETRNFPPLIHPQFEILRSSWHC